MITVIDVMRTMRVEPTASLSTSVGNKVRDLWESMEGELPVKRLHPKTSGNGGSHCIATYPESMRPRIEQIIREHVAEAARQYDLFL